MTLDLESAKAKRLPDVLRDDLRLVFVGINPSLYSAATGFHYARPGNRFWPAIHMAGISDRRLDPAEQQELLAADVGLTNLAARATARADELTAGELRSGLSQLKRKVRRRRIARLAFLGVTAFRQAAQQPKAAMGRQTAKLGQATVFVLPNPSGLNAHYQLEDFATLFRDVYEATV